MIFIKPDNQILNHYIKQQYRIVDSLWSIKDNK